MQKEKEKAFRIETEKNKVLKETIRYFKKKRIDIKIFSLKKPKYRTIWNSEEDRKLKSLVETENLKDWNKVSSYFENKSSTQCSARYLRINPINKKGKWSKEEDDLLLKLIKSYGKNWGKITKEFKSRTGKQVRERFINVLDPDITKNKFDQKEDEVIVELYEKLGSNWSEISKHLQKRTPDMIKNRFNQFLKRKYKLGKKL